MKRIFEAAKLFFPVFLEIHKDELGDKKGLLLVINEIANNKTGHYTVIGEVHEDKVTEKKEFAYEKVDRLRERNQNGKEELTSFASEDVQNKKFGGGIKSKNYFLGASNLPPHLDQKFLVMLCLLTGELTHTSALQIMEESFLQRKAWEQNPQN